MPLLLIRSQTLKVSNLRARAHTHTHTLLKHTFMNFVLYPDYVQSQTGNQSPRLVLQMEKNNNHLNTRILVTLQNLIFSKILPNHSQMAESDSLVVSIFNQRKEREGMLRMQRGVDMQKSQGIHAECTL